jgi:1,4-alpha-glucan branching enzyme
MPGDEWQRFANLRLLYAFMHAHPGKQLLFMGGEFAQGREWNHDTALDWYLLENPMNAGIQRLQGDLNTLHRSEPALHEVDFEPRGFEWVEGGDRQNSVVAFLRRGKDPDDFVLAVLNFTPVIREGYRVGVPEAGRYAELLNTDAGVYGGSDVGNGGAVEAEESPSHGRPYSLSLTLPPLGALFSKPAG